MSRILKPLGASVDDFKEFLQTGEGKVADIIRDATKLASENKGLSVTLDSTDSVAAVQALEAMQAQIEKLWDAIPAQEALDAKANTIIEKYLYSDRTKMVNWYLQQVKIATTQNRIDKLVDDIADDIDKMEDFVDGEMTFSSFIRFLVSWKAFWIAAGISVMCPPAAIILIATQYHKVEKIRERTQRLMPIMYDVFRQAKKKQKDMMYGKVKASNNYRGDDDDDDDGDED